MTQPDRIAASSMRPAQRWRRSAIAFAAFVCIFGLALPVLNRTVPSTANTVTWLLDLAAHWQPLYALGWLTLCILCALRAWRWLMLMPLALLPLFTASKPLPEAAGGTPTLIVVAANVHVGNRDPAPLVAWLRAQPADVVAISELSPEYATALQQQLGDDYPYRWLRPEDSPFGIGILSRRMLYKGRRMQDDPAQALIVQVRVGEHTTRLIAAHPMPPLAPEWHSKRNALLRLVAETTNTPVILAGDLNATPWSTALTGAAQDGLFRATSLIPTWPRWGRGVFGIPIDHVLASAHWRRGESSRGPDIGSDHYPVRVALSWADDRGVE
jgi:endonuclease/exonuclease/phosphatase (EEP) superfamily protein YafD